MLEKDQNTSCLKNVGYDLVLFSTFLAILLAKDLSTDDQNLLSVLLQAIGQNLAVIATVQSNCEENNLKEHL